MQRLQRLGILLEHSPVTQNWFQLVKKCSSTVAKPLRRRTEQKAQSIGGVDAVI